MKRYVSPSRSCRSVSRLMTCDWVDTSSAETGSSSTTQARVERERAGDRDPLALPAGELVGVAAQHVPAHARPARAGSRPASSRCTDRAPLVDLERLADRLGDRLARIERRVRVLEDDLHVAAGVAQRRAVPSAVTSAPSSRTAPAVGSTRRRTQPGHRRLARSGLAHQPERLARRGSRSRRRRRPGPRRSSRRSTRAADREVLAQTPRPTTSAAPPSVATAALGRGSTAYRVRASRRASSSSARHAPDAARSVARRSTATGVLDARRLARARTGRRSGSPTGHASGVGTCPGITLSGSPGGVVWGIDASSPAEYGWRGRAKIGSSGASSTTWPAYITTTRSQMSATTPRSWVTKTIAIPVSRCSTRSRSRICAWIVTSSAVGGLVGDQELRVVGERHRDHRPLAHPTRERVRVVLAPAGAGPGSRPGRASRRPGALACARVRPSGGRAPTPRSGCRP